MDGLAGALGSVVGYLGAEVAEEEVFEKLLWPQRFYNDCTAWSLVQQFFLMGMGGPMHRAALATLDDLRDHGLYLGPRRGDMLGTAFYKDSRKSNFWRTHPDNASQPKDSRNALWVGALRDISGDADCTVIDVADPESQQKGEIPLRAFQLVHHLKLKLIKPHTPAHASVVRVQE